jgi:4-hydroxythreonine-4-phosphate dehydrogenase
VTHAPALALTRGDPSGIGIEIALKAWLAGRGREAAEPFFLLADLDHVRRTVRALDLDVPLVSCTPADARAAFGKALPLVPLDVETLGIAGQPDATDAPGTIASIERAAELVAAGEASAVVTLPVSKEILHRVGYPHPGQTEFMGALSARLFGQVARPVMLIWSHELAVVPTTIHVAVSQVAPLLSEQLIVDTIRVVDGDFRRRFGLSRPRIAVTGLNPHAGEGGDIGREEIEIVAPALDRLRQEGIAVTGPHPADTLFHRAARERYDVAVTMFHDQALIPVKTLAFDTGVNVTLGLPFVRTSPDHGTAFDIAGRGIADPTSLLAALDLAARLARADAANAASR